MAIPIAVPRSSSSGCAAASMAKPAKHQKKWGTEYKSDIRQILLKLLHYRNLEIRDLLSHLRKPYMKNDCTDNFVWLTKNWLYCKVSKHLEFNGIYVIKHCYFICTFWRLIKANLVLCTLLAFYYLKSNMSTHSMVIFIGTVTGKYNIITGLERD